MAALRLFALLLLSVAAAGCTSVHTVQRSDPEALARLTDELRGQRVEVIRDGIREYGSYVRIAQDSTRWGLGDAARSVPTTDVRAFVLNPRPRNVRTGFFVGALVFGALMAGACAEFSEPGCYPLLVPVAALGGGSILGFYGAAGSEVVEYRLVD